MRLPALLLLVLSSVLLVGCGGGGETAPQPVTVVIPSTPGLDGHVFASGTVSTQGNITAGDYANQAPAGGIRGFVSFDLAAAGIPAGATVQTAVLTLVQRNVNSAPYATLGAVVVDQVVYGSVLEAGAYDRQFPSHQGFATLSTDATLGPKTVTATAQVQSDLASLRTRSQFRIRFPIEEDLDTDSDQAQFWAVEAPVASDRPTLLVTYVP